MTAGLILLEAHREIFMPAWGFGLLAFGLLVTAVILVHHYSQNRPHS